ncbi:hypothetical protein [Streptomyces sp. KL116D]|uniref:hypothetical protein n=1 Tax=Streptomyces sp. KL116D TaxID=3045152 RepID=UPI0035591341
MPYSQFFSGGQAFHAIYGGECTARSTFAAAWCMRLGDAKKLWGVLKRATASTWEGRKPGT